MQMPEGCHHQDMPAAADNASKQSPSHDGMQHGEHAKDMSGCGTSAGCMLNAAVLPTVHRFSMAESVSQFLPVVSSQFTSFFPEGLHRPPNLLS